AVNYRSSEKQKAACTSYFLFLGIAHRKEYDNGNIKDSGKCPCAVPLRHSRAGGNPGLSGFGFSDRFSLRWGF
ncbi:TPA: hypothetical protein ACKJ9F_001121, partial [Neisseria gonorrhoeae]